MGIARYDIFVSYSRANDGRVRLLVEALRRRGYWVFYDQEDIQVADKWKDRLSRSIAASRVLVLCWSREATASDYVRYELFRAEGLKKPVLPWLLDSTELPKLVEIQGIVQDDPAEVVERLRPRLGMRLWWLRLIQSSLLGMLIAGALVGYQWTRRPWVLTGQVRTTAGEAPLAGVTVEATLPAGRHYKGATQADGRYMISIPLPKPAAVDILFRKQGFDSDHEPWVTTDQEYLIYLSPSRPLDHGQ